MLYVYIVAAVAAVPLLNNFMPVFSQSHSWWSAPLLAVGFFVGFIVLHAAVLFGSTLFISLSSPAERGSKFMRGLVNLTLPMAFSLVRVKIHTTGKDKIPENERVLLVCNHTHDIDPAVIIREFPELELGFVAKREIYTDMKPIAKIMHKLYCLPINRENNREAAKTIILATKLIKEDKASIGIFPEGYTSRTGELQPMRNGAFKIAQKAGVPIVVCSLVGTRAAVKKLFFCKNDIYLDVLEVISAEETKALSTAEIGDRVYSEMLRKIEQRTNML